MKIVVVVDSINVDDSSGSKANVALINNLASAGFEVYVYHYTLKNIQLDGVSCISIPEIKSSLFYFLSRLQRILWRNFNINIASFLEGIFGFSFTFFNDVNSIKQALLKMDFKPDLVLTLSKGASFRPHYSVLKLPQFHDKWMAYVHDPYPFHCYPRPFDWVESSYRQKEIFFKEVSEMAKYSSFPSLLLKEWMGSYFPNFLKTGVVVPHQNFDYNIKNCSPPSYFDESKFNLLHAGNLLQQRSPEGLINGFKLFLEQNPQARNDAKLFFIGRAHEQHLKVFEELNIPEIYFCNEGVSFEVVYNMQKKASVNIILEAKAATSPFLPGKFPHCVEANKVILSLAPYQSETRRLLGNNYPYWAEADDVQKIAGIIEKLYLLWIQNPDKLLLNRKDLEEYLSASYLKTVIDKLTSTES
ncbi:MAG: UDP-glycosyltransferase [Flavobacterium sp.]|jgi:hypothetical protein|nr:UDP-glycosyltransferase [Flavobacterium sp.]MBP6586062.1 UDP-glycosyltransferase [Flavobacterium sp.]